MTTLISNKQRESLKYSNSKINIWEGSVRAGKTYISLWRFLKEITYGTAGEYAILAKTYDSFKRNLLPQLTRMIGADARHYSGKRELHIWGKTIHIIGCDDERAETKIRGSTFQGAYVDEATIIPESVFKMLISRCAMGNARIFCTTNPDSPYHWLKRDYLTDNPDVASWCFTLDDNPQLLPDEKDYLKRQYKGLWYQRFIEGRWVQAEGSIYDQFDESIHLLPHPPGLPQYHILGVDYGTSNPCAFVLIGVNLNKYPNIWVEDEYYYDSKKHQRQKTDAEYASDLVKFCEGRSVRQIYIDPSAVSFRVELQKIGVTNLFEAENEVIDGIRFVAKYLNIGKLKICKAAKNLISEFQSYVWDPKYQKRGEDHPLKERDHALDALRYAIYTHFFGKDNTGMTASELDKLYSEATGYGQANLPAAFQQPSDYSSVFPRF